MSRSADLLTRYVILVMCCMAVVACLAERKLVVQGVLHGELTWQGEVLIAGDVLLEEDVSLTILPGTRVRFMSQTSAPGGRDDHPYFQGSELIIKGLIKAVGTPSEPIIFEALDPAAPAGSWGAINLEGSQEAVFEYCVFRQADSAVHSRDSQVYIEQSVFENNLVGVRFNNSAILIEHNLLRNNQTGVRFHLGSPVICANQFIDNSVNLFVTSHPREYRIEYNSFGLPGEYHVVLGEDVPEDVAMAHNFWADAGNASFGHFFYDGQRSPYLGRVLMEPLLTTPSAQTGLSWKP